MGITVTMPEEDYNELKKFKETSCVCIQSEQRFGKHWYYTYESNDEALNSIVKEFNGASKERAESLNQAAKLRAELKKLKGMSQAQFRVWRREEESDD